MASTSSAVADVVVAGAAGYIATKVMEQFNARTYALEPERDRLKEEEVRPGPPFRLAAQNLSRRVLGIELAEQGSARAGLIFHYLAGWSSTPVYALFRRRLGWRPLAAGMATGASMSLILDEVITPAISASAPNTEYPISTHVRAFVARRSFGLAMAAVTEAGWRLLGRRP